MSTPQQISSRDDLRAFLEADRRALGKTPTLKSRLIGLVAPDPIWTFQIMLRRLEYAKNCRKSLLDELRYQRLRIAFRALSLKLGFSIGPNVFGPGLSIQHYGTIVIHSNARIGANCRIHACTNIGASGGSDKAPVLGNNVYVGPGAKIYGDITIANNIAIAANAAVSSSFAEENIMIGGVPAKRIKSIDISRIIPVAH